jgi:ribosome biogenesis GTPase
LTGTVFRKSIGRYWVRTEDREVDCSISNRLRKRLLFPTADPSSISPHVVAVREIETVDPVAVGDKVEFRESGPDAGVIVGVLPRRNKLTRRAAGRQPLEQVVAANLDQVVAVIALAKPQPKWRLLDRYLAGAEFLGIPAIVCLTKADLVDDAGHADAVGVYSRIGYPVVRTSAPTGQGIEEVRAALRGRVSVLLGKSGVGKTTLLNAVQPGLGLKVQEVGDKSGKGRHTTTWLEMHRLDGGGFVVDTPGIREFGLWDAHGTDTASLFRELRPYLGRCRFGAGCSHSHEPGCAVKEAVERGEVSRARYDSFRRLCRGS